jgi:tRNA threonylcarbamoyladenosine biosynthesis protein TsaE
MKANTIVFGQDELPQVAKELVGLMDRYKIFTFTGPLGAGKTSLIRQMLELKGVTQPITSPTFTYVNLYENEQGQLFYHFDLYRIETLDAFISAGFNEYLYAPNSWAFIEWPEAIMPLLTESVCHCTLEYHDKKRTIKVFTS